MRNYTSMYSIVSEKFYRRKNPPIKFLGRPTNSPKDVMVRVRMDKTTLSKLDKCVDLKGSNRSQVIRDAIVLVYSKIKK